MPDQLRILPRPEEVDSAALLKRAEALDQESGARNRTKLQALLRQSPFWVRVERAECAVVWDLAPRLGREPTIPEACEMWAADWHRLGELLRGAGLTPRARQLQSGGDAARGAAVELLQRAVEGASVEDLAKLLLYVATQEELCRFRNHVRDLIRALWEESPGVRPQVPTRAPEPQGADSFTSVREQPAAAEASAGVRAPSVAPPEAGACRPRLTIDLATNCITLDGTPWPELDPVAVRIVQALQQKGGCPIAAKELQRSILGCRGDEKTLRNYIKKLPEPIRACIKAQSGRGRWLELPWQK
jgi:hypothetical protein